MGASDAEPYRRFPWIGALDAVVGARVGAWFVLVGLEVFRAGAC